MKMSTTNYAARAEAFGTTAVPVTAEEFARLTLIGAIKFLSPFTGEVADYKPYLDGKPVKIVGGAHAAA
jgi:hypothetical protein